jgi:osmotically inducible protein OsmC
MSLSNLLAEHGHAPQSVETTAKVELRVVDGEPAITAIALTTRGEVQGIDEDHFREHAEEAKAACPVSKALAGVGEITVDAKLVP